MLSLRNTRSIEKYLRGLNPPGSFANLRAQAQTQQLARHATTYIWGSMGGAYLYSICAEMAVVWVRRRFLKASSRLNSHPYLRGTRD